MARFQKKSFAPAENEAAEGEAPGPVNPAEEAAEASQGETQTTMGGPGMQGGMGAGPKLGGHVASVPTVHKAHHRIMKKKAQY